MKQGGVPTDSKWKVNSKEWINCEAMRQHFKVTKNYWTQKTYSTCNAGGIILLWNSVKPYHAMMNVHNDGVSTKYSAHTNDRKAYAYKANSFAGNAKVEYFVFDKVSPAH